MFRDLFDAVIPIALLIMAIVCGTKAMVEATNPVQNAKNIPVHASK